MYRYITIKKQKDLPKAYIKKLLHELSINVTARLKTERRRLTGATITKSVLARKRRTA